MPDLRTLLVLGRVSNLPTVWANTLAAWFVSGGTWDVRILGAALAGSLAYYGGMAWNDVHDADWDRAHGKTRPIPAGRLRRSTGAWIASATTAVGLGGLLALGADLAWIVALGLSILLYTVLHKRWSGSVWLMGACRLFLFVAVASILAPPDKLVWFWGGCLLVYVAGITLAARGEDGSGRVPPVAATMLELPGAAGLVLALSGGPALVWTGLAAVAVFAIWQFRVQSRFWRGELGIGPFIGRLLAGMVLVDAMAIAVAVSDPFAAVACALFLPVNLGLQRLVPAT